MRRTSWHSSKVKKLMSLIIGLSPAANGIPLPPLQQCEYFCVENRTPRVTGSGASGNEVAFRPEAYLLGPAGLRYLHRNRGYNNRFLGQAVTKRRTADVIPLYRKREPIVAASPPEHDSWTGSRVGSAANPSHVETGELRACRRSPFVLDRPDPDKSTASIRHYVGAPSLFVVQGRNQRFSE